MTLEVTVFIRQQKICVCNISQLVPLIWLDEGHLMEKISTFSYLDSEVSYTIYEYIDFVAYDFPDGIIDSASDVFEKG